VPIERCRHRPRLTLGQCIAAKYDSAAVHCVDHVPQVGSLMIDELGITSEEWEYMERRFEVRQLRKERPWTFDIIRVLSGSSSTSMARLTHELWTIRNPSGLPMPKKFPETIQSCLNRHTSQSSRWTRKPKDDLFYSPEGKGSGTWAVRRDVALEWLKAHRLPDV
jgi:hypothetical protein